MSGFGWMWDVTQVLLTGLNPIINAVTKRKEEKRKQRETSSEFLTSLFPNAVTHKTAAISSPAPNGQPAETDLHAATSLADQMVRCLGTERFQSNAPQQVDLNDLLKKDFNRALFGGASANASTRALLGFHGNERYRYTVDLDCPLWQKKVLRYYSVSSVDDFSDSKAINAFAKSEEAGHPNPRISGLKWGIATPGNLLIPATDFEWTLLITRVPNFFYLDTNIGFDNLGLMIADGVHGEATEAFRLLFEPQCRDLLHTIATKVRNKLVFQIPLVVERRKGSATSLRLLETVGIYAPESFNQKLHDKIHNYVRECLISE